MGQRRGGEFFATLKKELVHQCDYVDQAEARASIFEYIEIFYNRIRLHSALGGMSPEQFSNRDRPRRSLLKPHQQRQAILEWRPDLPSPPPVKSHGSK